MSSTDQLHILQEEIRSRVEDMTSAHGAWPCRKGCDDCCRRLASVPAVTREEWQRIAAQLDHIEPAKSDIIRNRIRQSVTASRPVVCPLLDRESGACLVYEARPIACRSYGFYVERESVLGCHRIESIAEEAPGIIWGNGTALQDKLQAFGAPAELHRWLDG
jgi:Fe-S-cluster containining protein